MDRKTGLLMPLLLLGLLTGLCSFARADNQPQSTHRAVSSEDWTYAAMRHVLEDLDVPGLSPVHFLGDFTFNAREMAAKAWACYEASVNREEGLPQDTRRWLIALLREFEEYRKSTQKRLKVFRLEAVRAGFKKAWQERDYATIIGVGRKIPENVLHEDPKLLMWYDWALTRRGEE